MSESERRRGYRYNRVLIETARVLDPQFADAVVFLSGAQIELLRNVAQYLNRLETYVTEYNPGYYLAPTVADYDDILAIVADLEETLMGNPNTLWGYKERWSLARPATSTGEAYTDAETFAVPAGKIYVLEQWNIVHADTVSKSVSLAIMGGSGVPYLFEGGSVSPGDDVYDSANITLAEGDYLRFRVWGLADTKTCTLTVWGHMMDVPE